jgi:hypothetical protein
MEGLPSPWLSASVVNLPIATIHGGYLSQSGRQEKLCHSPGSDLPTLRRPHLVSPHFVAAITQRHQ